MDLLDNPVHKDAWGSPTAIPAMLGEPPDGEPRSELWMGSHPSASSRLERGGTMRTLADVISADPIRELGDAVVGTYGARLPFLVKILAAATPLSLQAHPSQAQAAAGYADEEQRGIAVDDPSRNYVDANHKPEMLCALTDFDALCGFRVVDETIGLLQTLDVPGLAPDLAVLQANPGSTGLRAAVGRLLHLAEAERTLLVAAVAARCAEIATGDGVDATLAQTVVELASIYPDDAGVLCALLMNRVTLAPGQAVFLAAGNLHAYLHGVGVEIMASSDNVMRGGLTARHVDVDALLAILDTTPGPVPLVSPRARGETEVRYPTPVPDFALSRLTLRSGQPYELADHRPRILLVVDGGLTVTQGGRSAELAQGRSAFFPAGDPPATLTGNATAFLATTAGPAPRVTAVGGAAG